MRKNPLKLNVTYTSLYDLLCEFIPFVKKFDQKLGFEKDYNEGIQGRLFPFGLDRSTLNNNINDSALMELKSQMWGGIQPLADAVKDGVDTFKFYKGPYQFKRDLLQPINGLGNIFKGLAILVFFIPCTIIVPICFLLREHDDSTKCLSDTFYGRVLQSAVIILLSWPVDAISSIVRGITQIAFTPLTYLVKIPLRMLITYYAKPEDLVIEKNKGIVRLLGAARTIIRGQKFKAEQALGIVQELNEKFLKAQSRGQKTSMENTQIEALRELACKTKPYNEENEELECELPVVQKEELMQIYGFFRPARNSEKSPHSTSASFVR